MPEESAWPEGTRESGLKKKHPKHWKYRKWKKPQNDRNRKMALCLEYYHSLSLYNRFLT